VSTLEPFLEPGVIYGIGTLGLALIYRYLRFPDFTVLGSIVCGGVFSVFFTNALGPLPGILLGTCVGAVLGLLTGLLAMVMRIQPVLAGIITFTASSSPAFLATDGGRIDLLPRAGNLLVASFAVADLVLLVVLAGALCGAVAAFMRTKAGSLLLAMTANRDFVRFRHRYQRSIFVITVMAGNAIVALAGGLHAVNDAAAHAQAHFDFLPFALGAVFAGNAVTAWASKVVHRYEIAGAGGVDDPGRAAPGRLSLLLGKALSVNEDSGLRVLFLLVTYVLGCFCLLLISRAVQADILGTIHANLSLPSEWQWAVVALLMTFFVWWSGAAEEAQQ